MPSGELGVFLINNGSESFLQSFLWKSRVSFRAVEISSQL